MNGSWASSVCCSPHVLVLVFALSYRVLPRDLLEQLCVCPIPALRILATHTCASWCHSGRFRSGTLRRMPSWNSKYVHRNVFAHTLCRRVRDWQASTSTSGNSLEASLVCQAPALPVITDFRFVMHLSISTERCCCCSGYFLVQGVVQMHALSKTHSPNSMR